ncbi:4-alpha-glucanotransferase [Eremococcus coleocola]|uniref:4-alpha-glucanotransferase n=1 Tax=Eremococcus coleocola ACS-139-V-Col8 TaxID=908337 RepID=E4KNB8_9LACT|nr:4-alpha-glucanotransferase [Eremococcus coleocola]EFR31546.1 4-alpha-glucanotransferase [Eremococcus coleocola ACS-139-V-Col8]
MERLSGVLMHISSLPNQYGIGSFGQAAYDFVDFLKETKQSYWQILPLTTTSYGDSPYQSFSAFAGNTYFIDLDQLLAEGLLVPEDLAGIDFGRKPDDVDYGLIFQSRQAILQKAVDRFLGQARPADYETFIQEKAEWLEPFAEYMAIKESFGLASWMEWDQDIQTRQPQALDRYRQELAAQMDYHRVTQYWFFKQWQALKGYANQNHIQIIGDMPIYVAADSVEMWATPEYFKTDAQGRPTVVAGTPPDDFSADGQYWGNPIYDWDYMKANGYQWWVKRIQASFELYDRVRIDHFRGFESYWEVPFGSPSSAHGYWVKGPGYDLFRVLKEKLGDLDIIAEDLGFMTPEVHAMREATGFPSMKILQFGFNGHNDSTDLPHHYFWNTAVYVGTHDNETAMGWWNDTASQAQKDQLVTYLHKLPNETPAQALNRGLAQSVSRLAVYTMQDLLSLGNEARMNEPSTIGKNWKWRMTPDQLNQSVTDFLKNTTEVYFRSNPKLTEKE